MVFAHVINVKTGLERKNVTVKAYQLTPNSYTLLGYVDENGDPVAGPTVVQKAGKKKEAAEPVIRKQMSPEEIEAKKAELKAMNEAALQKVRDEQAAKKAEESSLQPNVEEPVKVRQKPGPKPKQHA